MTNEDYTKKITWPEVRKGDVLMHANGDRMTVSAVDHVGYQTCKAAGTWRSVLSMTDAGFFPYRKVEPLTTVPGAYLDKDGDYWLIDKDGSWYDWSNLRQPTFYPAEPYTYAPFTRLVPMPTEEQIRETLFKTDPGTIYGVDAVVDGMKSLLGGGDDA